MKKITDGVYCFRGMPASTVFLITEGDGLTLVDAGMPNAPNKIVRQMKKAGHVPAQITRILITHSHMDHIGGLRDMKAITGGKVICSEGEKQAVEAEAPVDQVVEDGDTIDGVLGGLEVIVTPGHTAGHTLYWQPERRILFVGDALMNWMNRLSLPFKKPTLDMDKAIESARQIAELEPSIMCFGHGPAILDNTTERLKEFIATV